MRKKQKTKPTSNLHTLYIMLCCNVGWLIIGFTCARIVKIYIIYSNIYHHPLLSILNDPQTCYHLRVRVYIIYYTLSLSHTHTLVFGKIDLYIYIYITAHTHSTYTTTPMTFWNNFSFTTTTTTVFFLHFSECSRRSSSSSSVKVSRGSSIWLGRVITQQQSDTLLATQQWLQVIRM